MTGQVESQDGEAAVGEPACHGPPPIEVSAFTVNEHCPTISFTPALAAQRQGARPGKLNGDNVSRTQVRRLGSHPTTPSRVQTGCVGVQWQVRRRSRLRSRCLRVRQALFAPET